MAVRHRGDGLLRWVVAKKVTLPLLGDPELPFRRTPALPKTQSVDVARVRLGGRIDALEHAPRSLSPGAPVAFLRRSRGADLAASLAELTGVISESGPQERQVGVVVFASAEEVHVLLDETHLRRLPAADVEAHAGPVDPALEKIAGDARVFASLVERQSIRYATEAGELLEGRLIEKCRWGALVLRADGSIVAVGFRKLWPAPNGGVA